MAAERPTSRTNALLRCAHHTTATAGWTCEACGPLCPACVARVRVDELTQYDTCVRCDAHVPPLLVPGPAASFLPLLRSHFFGSISWRLLVGLVASLLWSELTLCVEVYAHGTTAVLMTFLSATVLAVAFCALTVDTARGPDELERTEPLALISEAVVPAWPVVLLLTLFFLEPVVLPAWSGRPPNVWIWDFGALSLSALIGVLLPRVALQQAVRCSGGSYRNASKLPPELLLLGAGFGALIHLFLWGSASSASISLWGWAEPVRIFVVLFTLALARVAGLALHASAPDVGFPLPARYQVPLMRDVVPTGVPAPKKPVAPARSYAPIEL